MRTRLVLCDLDDVIVDFCGGALAAHGWSRAKFEAWRLPGQWDMAKAMRLSYEGFWAPIAPKGQDFWLGLAFNSWATELTELLNRTRAWGILTAPPPHSTPEVVLNACLAKTHFIHRNFSTRVIERSAIYGDKSQLATPDTVLIDDKEENVEAFEAAGGRGIVFPTRGNDLHEMAGNPLHYVKFKLEQYQCI